VRTPNPHLTLRREIAEGLALAAACILFGAGFLVLFVRIAQWLVGVIQ